MRKYLSAFLRFLLFPCMLLNGYQAGATHIVAADMLYKWISGNTYQVTVILYGDCGQGSATAFSGLPVSKPEVCIFNRNVIFTSISLNIQAPVCGEEMTQVICPGTTTQCTDLTSAVPGIKQFIYTNTVTLPDTSSCWRFIYNGSGGSDTATPPCPGATGPVTPPVSGRGVSITNILNAGTSIMQLIDTLNNAAGHNSSPLFKELPTPFFCLGINNCYAPQAVDIFDSTLLSPAGDKMVFSLVPATVGQTNCDGVGDTVTYTGTAWGYPSLQPITGATPLQVDSANNFYFDPGTGNICFLPNIEQRSDVVYNLREFRNGVFIGSCQREMTFGVQLCTTGILAASYGHISAGTLTANDGFQICTGAGDFSMTMDPYDNDTSAKITISNGPLPAGATFTVLNNHSTHPHCTFSWTTNGVPPGTYTYYVVLLDDHCPLYSKLTKVFQVVISDSLSLVPTIVNEICGNAAGSIKINVSQGAPPFIYTWSNGATASNITGLKAGTYSVNVKNTAGCQKSITVGLIDTFYTIDLIPVVNNDICNGKFGSINLGISGGTAPYTYKWSNDSAGNQITAISSGTYSVSVSDINGCKKSISADVGNIDHVLDIAAAVKNDICHGNFGTISVDITGGTPPYHFKWSTDSTRNEITTLPSGTYSVTVTDVYGCLKNATLNVEEDVCPEVVIHDVITPNGDGVNDVWVIEGILNYPTNNVQLFDKWGNKVFDQNNYKNDWNGRGNNGNLLPDGTYYYLVKLNHINEAGGKNLWTGSMLIKR